MKLTLRKNISAIGAGDICCVFVTEEQAASPLAQTPEEIKTAASSVDFSSIQGKLNECFYVPLKRTASIVICGLGKTAELSSDSLRAAGAALAYFCKSKNIAAIHCLPPVPGTFTEEECLRLIGEGISLAAYKFNKFKKNDIEAKVFPEQCFVYSNIAAADKIIKQLQIVCDNVNLCRDLINDASYNSTPEGIAAVAKKIASNKNVKCQIFNKNQLEALHMGLLLAVNQGSARPAQMAVLSYKGAQGDKTSIALVGKGITFDSGGMNLKSNGHIETMRMDMAGAATVMYALKTAAELGIKKNIFAVMPLTENMLSNTAYRPGDVFTAYNGLTVEIGNTDAEGRLILADALAYTVSKIKPTHIIDVATLTGACVVTFGETIAGLVSTNDELCGKLQQASKKTGEKLWRLPLYKEFEDDMKSEIADISNMSSEKNAGTIHGGAFLKKFTGGTPWAHLDIAGTAWASKVRGCYPKNATGWGVMLLTDLLINWDNY